MKIGFNKEITVTMTETEVCAIVYAIRKLNLNSPDIDTGPFTERQLLEKATSVHDDFIDAMKSPINP